MTGLKIWKTKSWPLSATLYENFLFLLLFLTFSFAILGYTGANSQQIKSTFGKAVHNIKQL